MNNTRLKRLLAPLAFGAGVGAAVGAVAGAYPSVQRMDYGKGLPWLAVESVLEEAQTGLAIGALCAMVGLLLARIAGRKSERWPTAWIVTGLVALLAVGWFQDRLWEPPQGWVGRLVFFSLPVVTVLGGLGVVRTARWMAGETGHRSSLWRWLTYMGTLAVAGFLALGGLMAAHERAARDRPNILFVVVDCLRADRLGAYGYDRGTSPRLDRLAARALVFERAYSTAAWTKPAIVSVLTGLYPTRHGSVDPFDVLPRRTATVPELLRNAGYETLFLNAGNVFVSDEFGFDAVFDDFEMLTPGTASQVVDAFSARLPGMSERPFFAYLHFMDAHLPYASNAAPGFDPGTLRPELRPGAINVGTVRALSEKGRLTATDRELVGRLYDAQVRFVDREIARLLETLGREGLAQRTLVVVTADHGEELWEHGNFEHGHTLYDEVTRVPLLIAGPGVAPERRREPVSLVDLAPAILGWAGIRPQEELEGIDLLARSRRKALNRPGVFLSGTLYGSEKFGFVSSSGKALVNTELFGKKFPLVGPRSFAEREWYVAGDSGESDNRVADAPGAAWEVISGYRESVAVGVDEADPSEDARRRLEALGYLQ